MSLQNLNINLIIQKKIIPRFIFLLIIILLPIIITSFFRNIIASYLISFLIAISVSYSFARNKSKIKEPEKKKINKITYKIEEFDLAIVEDALDKTEYAKISDEISDLKMKFSSPEYRKVKYKNFPVYKRLNVTATKIYYISYGDKKHWMEIKPLIKNIEDDITELKEKIELTASKK